MVRTSTIVEATSEKVLTNLLPITSMPKSITFYEYEGDNTKVAAAMNETGVPHGMFNRHIISFAATPELQERLPPSFTLAVRAHVALDAFLAGSVTDPSSPIKDAARKMVTSLLRQHVESHLQQRGLREFKTSTASAFYFPSDLVPNDKVPYLAASGRRTHKNVVGRSERNKVHWHLAMKINIVLGPPPIVRLQALHLLLRGRDRRRLTTRSARLRSADVSARTGGNPHWRQLLEAFCTFLADGKETVEIGLAGPEALVLAARPLELLATRRMPDDLIILDEPEDPIESDDDDATSKTIPILRTTHERLASHAHP